MEADIAAAKIAGADGVVIGALTPEGNLDIPVIQRLLRQAEGMDVTFHRAFDEVRAPLQALETLISLGIPRLLTSGQAPTAAEGAQLIAQLVRAAAGRISVMPGAGINPANIAAIEKATGAGEFHSTARSASLLSGSKYDRLPQEESALFGSRPRPTSRAVVAALVNG